MTEAERTSISKFLSLVLRHQPDAAGVTLDDGGWVAVDALLAGAAAAGRPLSRAALEEVVATSPKRRFSLSPDGDRIRAAQGHSVDVELGYAPATPPARLFHGTVAEALPAIRAEGLAPMARQHVHLSVDEATATVVAKRRGTPVIVTIDAAAMHNDGHVFFVADNGVWLTAAVPARYLAFDS